MPHKQVPAGPLPAGELLDDVRLGGGVEVDEALRAHENALEVAPENPSYVYDLGLCHKYAGRFAEGAEANRRSLDLRSGDEGALWNLGICATGAGDQDMAGDAWKRLGIERERSSTICGQISRKVVGSSSGPSRSPCRAWPL
jgi:tetratricopeptide (TPR) repeat protein